METQRVTAKTLILCARLFLIAGIIVGLPGLNQNPKQSDQIPEKTFEFSDILGVSPALANEDSQIGQAGGGLCDWPDLFGEAKEVAPIQPTSRKELTQNSPLSSSSSRVIRTDRKIAPPTEDSFPSLHASIQSDSALTSLRNVETARVSTQRQTVSEAVPEKPEPLKPIESSHPSQQIQAEPQVKVVQEEPVSRSPAEETEAASSDKKKGFVIKVENDGKELVVYDADGNEILRKSRKKSSEGTTITGAGKTVTNRSEPAKVEVPKPSVAKTEAEKEIVVPLKNAARKADLIFDQVKRGENLSLIASRYENVTADDLMRVNQIDDPHCIAAGTKIWIPTKNIPDALCHQVDKDETLSSLLKKYEIKNMFEVCELNGLDYYSSNKLQPGQMLVLPNAKRKHYSEQPHLATAIRPDLSKFKGNVRWNWPVEDDFTVSSGWGRRIDPFSKRSREGLGGPKPRFSMHHGIDLAVPVGTPVQAARDGEVIEVSHSRYGHGNSIKIRHDDGWVTVYSHNSKLLKKEGDKVKQGDLIAYSGNTGRSTGPHLHFEIRRPDQESVNPKSFLPKI
ncbi:MAG: M23 family metallopeptidase [Candidatus Omnitrophica bacterium]|nr:M23 family metallopeptidase [Candidatus Omnitrophota bacterium]